MSVARQDSNNNAKNLLSLEFTNRVEADLDSYDGSEGWIAYFTRNPNRKKIVDKLRKAIEARRAGNHSDDKLFALYVEMYFFIDEEGSTLRQGMEKTLLSIGDNNFPLILSDSANKSLLFSTIFRITILPFILSLNKNANESYFSSFAKLITPEIAKNLLNKFSTLELPKFPSFSFSIFGNSAPNTAENTPKVNAANNATENSENKNATNTPNGNNIPQHDTDIEPSILSDSRFILNMSLGVVLRKFIDNKKISKITVSELFDCAVECANFTKSNYLKSIHGRTGEQKEELEIYDQLEKSIKASFENLIKERGTNILLQRIRIQPQRFLAPQAAQSALTDNKRKENSSSGEEVKEQQEPAKKARYSR